MGTTVIAGYRTRPDAAAENARLVQAVISSAVFGSPAEVDPGDLTHMTYRLADGVTFVHVAHLLGRHNPLTTMPAFAEFQRELAQRCVELPAPGEAEVVGSYEKKS